jgi:hypothetical protein
LAFHKIFDMPKERKDRSVSFDRCKVSPYSCSSSRAAKRSSSNILLETDDKIKEWEEARCPVCIEHPHNAVLLICSSHDKGCRPYMCDTSYRHSNCLDQFCKSFSAEPQQEETQLPGPTSETSPVVTSAESVVIDMDEDEESSVTPRTSSCENQVKPKMVCPLCRGQIMKWTVVEPARRFMNAKPRSCSCETCSFTGPYKDLRTHARVDHPTVRPSDTDPERERNWRRMERQRDFADLLSTLQSSFGEESSSTDDLLPMDDGGWLTVLFFIRVIRPGSSSTNNPPRMSGATRRTRPPTSVRRRSTRLWGESHDVENGSTSSSREEDNESSDGGSAAPVRRRRIYRPSTPDDDEP